MSLLPLIVERQLIINRLVLMMELDDDLEDRLVHSKKRKKAHVMFERRPLEGAFGTLFQTYLTKDDKLFHRYLRLPPSLFYSLLADIEEDIIVQPTNRHPEPISPEQQLCVTLR